METSHANGGQLSASNAEVWTPPVHPAQGPQVDAQGRRAAAGQPQTQLAQAQLVRRVHRPSIPKYRDNTIATARLAIAAREHLFGWAEAEGIDST
jgi:D-amino-acid dehydrogenase